MSFFKKHLLPTLVAALFLLGVMYVVLFFLEVTLAEDPPAPSVPFQLLSTQDNSALYYSKVVFTTCELKNGQSFWKEVNASGELTGRIWIKMPSSSLVWDIVPVRDGSFGFDDVLPILYANNDGLEKIVLSFKNENPNFAFSNTEMKYGIDSNKNGTLDSDEELASEWYLHESELPINCNYEEVLLNGTTIVIIKMNHNGLFQNYSPPQSLNYPIWFVEPN